MNEGREVAGSGHNQGLPQLASELAESLRTLDLDVVIDAARAKAEETSQDYQVLMNEAVNLIFNSGEADSYPYGLRYLEWEADNIPDSVRANHIAHDAKFNTIDGGNRELSGLCFEVSLRHMRSIAQADDFELTLGFFEDLGAILARIDQEDYPGILRSGLEEFAPMAIEAVNNEEFEVDTDTIDSILTLAAVELRRQNPVLSSDAKSLITDDLWRDLCEEAYVDDQLLEAAMTDDFDKVREIVASPESRLIQRLWNPMIQALITQSKTIEWGNNVIDALLEANPEYFIEYSLLESDGLDPFIDNRVGVLVGLLDRLDIVDMLIIPRQSPDAFMPVLNGMAQGLGVISSNRGFNYLISKLDNYTEEARQSLIQTFNSLALTDSED